METILKEKPVTVISTNGDLCVVQHADGTLEACKRKDLLFSFDFPCFFKDKGYGDSHFAVLNEKDVIHISDSGIIVKSLDLFCKYDYDRPLVKIEETEFQEKFSHIIGTAIKKLAL